jgi:micrococcal nuclease
MIGLLCRVRAPAKLLGLRRMASGSASLGLILPRPSTQRNPVEHFGKEATAFTKRMVEGKRVCLEFDPAHAHRGHKDRTPQKRTLAYVFLEDGSMLNAEIIRQGYGFADTRFPFSRIEEFRRLERNAREQGSGLWNSLVE